MTDSDRWPGDPEAQANLVVVLDHQERSRVRRLESDPVRREQIVDIASERLLRRVRQGCPPRKPRAWLRRVVTNLLHSQRFLSRRTVLLETTSLEHRAHQTTPGETDNLRGAQRDWLRQWSHELLDDPRLAAVVRAALGNNGTKSAARSLGMDPSYFRRMMNRAAARLAANAGALHSERQSRIPPPPSS